MSRFPDLPCTRHARSRMQQRGIPPMLVDLHVLGLATVYLIDRAGEARIAREGEARGAELERLRGIYVVVAIDGTIRTVGHRTRRLRRH